MRDQPPVAARKHAVIHNTVRGMVRCSLRETRENAAPEDGNDSS